VDGFIAREDGSFSDFPWADEFGADLRAKFPETFPAHLRRGNVSRADNKRFGAVLMGRRTFEVGLKEGITSPYPTLDQYLFSRTLAASPDPAVSLVTGGAAAAVADLKGAPGKDIWICGGSELATSLFEAGLVDELIIKLNPIAVGSGIPLLSRRLETLSLRLTASQAYSSGHMLLVYAVGTAPPG
jgi:dihydrofolate reductase